MPLHFPEFFGDPVPFYWQGTYHIFYLSPRQPDHEWRHIATRDFLRWETCPTAIAPGTEPDAPDKDGCWTGSIFEHGGLFHLFYTGYRRDRRDTVICHATSADLIHWEKDRRNPILEADGVIYERSDWRDPHVMRHGDQFWMLITARTCEGLEARRGAAALATSPDLRTWTLQPPFWSHGLSHSPECIDVFPWRGRYLMVYSAHVEDNQTHFRTAPDLSGPWAAPSLDTFDGSHFYAAKTAGDETRRIVFGWVPRRVDESDTGDWYWGGSFALPRELVELEDGEIGVKLPQEIIDAPRQVISAVLTPRLGEWAVTDEQIQTDAAYRFNFATFDDLPDAYMLAATVQCDPGTRSVGLVAYTNPGMTGGYRIHVQPGTLSYEPLPRKFWTPPAPTRPHRVDLGQPFTLRLIVEGSLVEVFLDDQAALVSRAYRREGRSLGLFVQDGGAVWTNIRLEHL